MELGGLEWVEYIPAWKGNRELPAAEQLSVELKRRVAGDMLAEEIADDEVMSWAQEHFKSQLESDRWGVTLKRWDAPTWRALKNIIENTRHYRSFHFDGEELTDPAEIFLRLPLPNTMRQVTDEQGTPVNLLLELSQAIQGITGLTGDEAKNFVARYAGGATTLNGNAPAASTAAVPTAVDTP